MIQNSEFGVWDCRGELHSPISKFKVILNSAFRLLSLSMSFRFFSVLFLFRHHFLLHYREEVKQNARYEENYGNNGDAQNLGEYIPVVNLEKIHIHVLLNPFIFRLQLVITGFRLSASEIRARSIACAARVTPHHTRFTSVTIQYFSNSLSEKLLSSSSIRS